MKTMITGLLILISAASMAQGNGGQYYENNSVKLTLIAKVDGYYAGITSKQSCQSDFKLSYSNNTSNINLAAGAYQEVFLGAGITGRVKVKADSQCGNTDYGWVEINLSAMPLTFTTNPIISYDKATDMVSVKITVADVINVNHLKYRISFDGGRTKKILALYMIDYSNPNATYTYRVKRTDVLKLNANQ